MSTFLLTLAFFLALPFLVILAGAIHAGFTGPDLEPSELARVTEYDFQTQQGVVLTTGGEYAFFSTRGTLFRYKEFKKGDRVRVVLGPKQRFQEASLLSHLTAVK